MELEEFRKDFLESVKSTAAADEEGTVASFMKVCCDLLVDSEIIPDYELCYYSSTTSRGKKYRVDAYAFDDFDCSMSLFIADYSSYEIAPTLIKTDSNQLFERVHTFIDQSINSKLKTEIEISTPAYDLVERLNHLKTTITKFRLYILTDKVMSEAIGTLPFGNINGTPIEYHIWDAKRFFRVLGTGDGQEPIEIDFKTLTEFGIPCLVASDASTNEIKCYLCVLPGSILADVYDEYGSRLLEGNVRSFLTAKGKVNKAIRSTLLGENKTKFFAYNNGIAATASNVTIEKGNGGVFITSINNFQIVNGGQTTASLSNTRYRDKADLSGVFVQMKLTEIKEKEISSELIPNISRYSNSQNKVSDADFFSNHEFNIRMQQISRRIYAPAVNGAQFETHWFFERARGQYQQEMTKLTPAEKKKYELQNPKTQMITKTDFAKMRNTWGGYPHHVSMGAQKNFSRYAEFIAAKWEKDSNVFNEIYFQSTVAIAIMYKYLDKVILKQSWYEQGYKANIVTYSISLFRYLLRTQWPNKIIELSVIWNKQKCPDEIERQLTLIAKHVFEFITNENRKIVNVTEWCKKELCWTELKDIPFTLNSDIEDLLVEKEEESKRQKEGKKDQKLINKIEAQMEVIALGAQYWSRMLIWGESKKVLSDIDISFIMSATKIDYGRIPSEKQCQRLLNIQTKMKEEGFF